MRPQILHVFLFCTLVALAVAWSQEDHEIFRLRDEVEASEGVDTTFYDFLGIKSSATQEDISKAFRKRSKALHPDKVKHSFIASKSTAKPKKPGEKKKPGVHVSKGPSEREVQKFAKEASERYGRLGVVANILKGAQRERYDHFLRNGFPAWRGTGYYYKRYRPGLGTVLVGLFILGGGAAHYGALVLGWKRQREFMERYIRHARKAAWGDETGIRGIPGLNGPAPVPVPTSAEEADPMAGLNRRQKRQMEKEGKKEKSSRTSKSGRSAGTQTPPRASTAPATGEKKRILAENGKVLIVDSIGNVFLEAEDEDGNTQEFLLDIDEVQRPTIRDTALVRLPIWLYRKAFDPSLKDTSPVAEPVPSTESEQIDISVQDSSQDSGSSFEFVDSTAPDHYASAGLKKKGKKGKK